MGVGRLQVLSASVVAMVSESSLRLIDYRQGIALTDWRLDASSLNQHQPINDPPLSPPHGAISCTAAAIDSSWLAVGFCSGHIQLIGLRTGAAYIVMAYIAVAQLIRLRTGVLQTSWHAHESSISELAVATAAELLSASADLSIALWDVSIEPPTKLRQVESVTNN